MKEEKWLEVMRESHKLSYNSYTQQLTYHLIPLLNLKRSYEDDTYTQVLTGYTMGEWYSTWLIVPM